MDVVLSIVAILILTNGAWAGIRAMSRAGRRKGYRGPFLMIGLWALVFIGLGTVFTVAVVFARARVAALGMVGIVGLTVVGGLLGLLLGLGLVAALASRPERVAGVRHARFPFRALAAALGVAGVASPVLLVALGRDVGSSIPSGSGFLALAGFALAMARRTRTVQLARIDEVIEAEPFVLLLRGFGDEHRSFSIADAIRARRGIRRLIARFARLGDEVQSAQRYLGPAIGDLVAPVVALGNPADYVPPDSDVLRYYAGDDEWRRDVTRLAARARAVVVVASASAASLAWELRHLRSSGAMTRTFLVIGERRRDGLVARYGRFLAHLPRLDWSELVDDLAALGYRLPDLDPGPRTVFGFGADGTAEVLIVDAGSARDFATAIARALPR